MDEHGDTITAIPENFKTIASTDKVAIAAYQVEGEQVWGVQFHPEVFHSEDGTQMLRNFVVDVCGCKQDWSPGVIHREHGCRIESSAG